MTSMIDVLNKNGFCTGTRKSRAEVHKQGLIHRAVQIYLINDQGELLLQKRTQEVDHCPGVYSISATGHIDAGETSEYTAHRELSEELGLHPEEYSLEFAFSAYREAVLAPDYIDRQFNDIYVGLCNKPLQDFEISADEVAELSYLHLEEVERLLDIGDEKLPAVYKEGFSSLRFLGAFNRLLKNPGTIQTTT